MPIIIPHKDEVASKTAVTFKEKSLLLSFECNDNIFCVP